MGRPLECSTGPGNADADADEVARLAAGLLEEAMRVVATSQSRTTSGPSVMSRGSPISLIGSAAEVGQRDPAVRGADVGADDDAGLGVEGEADRWAPSGARRLAARREQARREQGVDAGADGRPGEPGQLRELGAGAWGLVAQQLQQLTGAADGALTAYADDLALDARFEVKHKQLRYAILSALRVHIENFCLTYRQKWVTV